MTDYQSKADELKVRLQNVLSEWIAEQDEEDLGMLGPFVLVYDVHQLNGESARYYIRNDQSIDTTWSMTQWLAKLYDQMMTEGFKRYLRSE